MSEPPIGWPVIGVISRATGKLAEDTFKIYKGHEHVDEWQFHVFDRGETVQMPGTPMPGAGGSRFLGPGFGGNGPIQGVGNGPRPGRPGPGGQMMYPQPGQGNNNYPGWNPGYTGGQNTGWNPGLYPKQQNQDNPNQNQP